MGKQQSNRLIAVVIVVGMLVLASLACTLGRKDNNPQAEPLVIPTQTPIVVPTVRPTLPIYIPPPTLVPTSTPSPTPVPCFVQASWPVYTVQPGDTLSSIAARTNTTFAVLALANCLPNSELIYPGQLLFVPFIPSTPTPIPTITPSPMPNPVKPEFAQPLTVEPHWLVNGRAVTESGTVRVNAGQVYLAQRVNFFVTVPGSTVATYIGADEAPWDGAWINYAFASGRGDYVFQAVAVNDITSTNSSSFMVRYDPIYVPPSNTQTNVLTLLPYLAFDGNWYTLQTRATIIVNWPDAPLNADRIDFVLTPTGTNMANLGQTIGSDLNPRDGAAIAWLVPGGILAHLEGVATMPDGSVIRSRIANVMSE